MYLAVTALANVFVLIVFLSLLPVNATPLSTVFQVTPSEEVMNMNWVTH
jgi:hypothetical protein